MVTSLDRALIHAQLDVLLARHGEPPPKLLEADVGRLVNDYMRLDANRHHATMAPGSEE